MYEVKNVRNLSGGLEGDGFSAAIYRDGKKIGSAVDQGNGGAISYDFVDAAERKAMQDYANSLPDMESESSLLELNLDIYVCQLIDAFELNQKLKRNCAKMTLFTLKGDPEGEYRTVKAPYSPKVKAFIVGKYGDKVTEIVNERYAAKEA